MRLTKFLVFSLIFWIVAQAQGSSNFVAAERPILKQQELLADAPIPTHYLEYQWLVSVREKKTDPWRPILKPGSGFTGDFPLGLAGTTVDIKNLDDNSTWTLAVYFPERINNLVSMDQKFKVSESIQKPGAAPSDPPVKQVDVCEMNLRMMQGKKAEYVFASYLTPKQFKLEIVQNWKPLNP